ncbi:MAG TPA: type II secretion system protein GspD [Oceanospirillales bacterium]|nr:type II secretion system protein GspD [Oceanospirillales bacterium]|tara:strand:+ start:2031 stop:3890 length:1860 start_codon:yes stop_codon:yes gene_type:complete
MSIVFGAVPLVSYAEDQNWQVNMKDADISAFIGQIADITGKSFVIDPRVKGKVTVVSTETMNTEAVYELFLSVLKVHGYAAVPAGEVIMVVQQNSVKQQGGDLEAQVKEQSQEMVTKVITIKNTPALDLVPILRPLVAKYGHLAGVRSANALIISDHASNISRVEQIIDRLDKSGSEELEVIQLKEAWVGNVVTMLQSLDPDKVAQGSKSNTTGSIRVVADERSNRLIIKGEKTSRERIRKLITQLDKPSYFSGSAKVIRLKYADSKKLSELLKNLMADTESTGGKDSSKAKGKASIFADEELNALVIRAEPSILKEIGEIIHELDVRRAQVLIESAIVEVSGDASNSFGVQWAVGDTDSPVAGTNFTNAGDSISQIATDAVAGTSSLSNGLTLGAYKSTDGVFDFGMVIQALQSQSNTNLLSTPSIMTLDNQEAEIIVGQNVPFITGSTSSSTNSNPFTTISREDIGVTLKIKPHIHEGNELRLEVEVTAESVSSTTVEGQADLITNKRELKTMILAADKETIVLGGLISDDITETESKVPFLGDIPGLGWLFKSKGTQHVKRNLMVFLRPTIVLEKQKAVELTNEKFEGIWEFDISGDLSEESVDVRMNRLFQGVRN